MHDDIKRFSLDGEVNYKYLAHARSVLEQTLEDKMRFSGYVPVLDIDPQLTQEYDSKEEKFRIKISLYGVYVGEEECRISGMMYGKPVKRHIPSDKLSLS